VSIFRGGLLRSRDLVSRRPRLEPLAHRELQKYGSPSGYGGATARWLRPSSSPLPDHRSVLRVSMVTRKGRTVPGK